MSLYLHDLDALIQDGKRAVAKATDTDNNFSSIVDSLLFTRTDTTIESSAHHCHYI